MLCSQKKSYLLLNIRCEEPRKLGSFHFVILQYRKRDVMKIDRGEIRFRIHFMYREIRGRVKVYDGFFRSIKT